MAFKDTRSGHGCFKAFLYICIFEKIWDLNSSKRIFNSNEFYDYNLCRFFANLPKLPLSLNKNCVKND